MNQAPTKTNNSLQNMNKNTGFMNQASTEDE
jgi:hypothetical protein